MPTSLQREYIPDLTNQRFQENADRLGKQIQKTVGSTTSDHETRLSNLEGVLIAVNLDSVGTVHTIPHGLNYVPQSWVVIDIQYVSGVPGALTPIRSSWDKTNIVLQGEGSANMVATFTIRVS